MDRGAGRGPRRRRRGRPGQDRRAADRRRGRVRAPGPPRLPVPAGGARARDLRVGALPAADQRCRCGRCAGADRYHRRVGGALARAVSRRQRRPPARRVVPGGRLLRRDRARQRRLPDPAGRGGDDGGDGGRGRAVRRGRGPGADPAGLRRPQPVRGEPRGRPGAGRHAGPPDRRAPGRANRAGARRPVRSHRSALPVGPSAARHRSYCRRRAARPGLRRRSPGRTRSSGSRTARGGGAGGRGRPRGPVGRCRRGGRDLATIASAGALRPGPRRRAGPHRRGRDRSHRRPGRRAGRRRRARRGPACGGRGPRRLRSRRRRRRCRPIWAWPSTSIRRCPGGS
jgi:hypothetical protein